MGLCIILRNSKGDILATLCTSYNIQVKPSLAETYALRSEIGLCNDLCLSKVASEVDAKNVFQTINSKKSGHAMDRSLRTLEDFYSEHLCGKLNLFIER